MQLKSGDLVKWMITSNHNYFGDKTSLGIFLEHIETYDHWILAKVLDTRGKKMTVMLQKAANPL